MPQDIINYFIHLVAGLLLVSVFVLVYTRITPYDELKLIRQGCISAAVSFGGDPLGQLQIGTLAENFGVQATLAGQASAALLVIILIATFLPGILQPQVSKD